MRKHKILIVDDEKISLRMTDHILSSAYDTVCASSGKEAIEIIRENEPDLVLTDLRMPEINGFMLRQIVEEEMGSHIPFMFMTADKKDETESKGFSIGVLDYIRKPFRADVLLRRVANIFANLEQIKGLKQAAETDPMTGLLNKVSSGEEIDKACRKIGGALMMIDLDSFKPVNDIYGHDMGDKILIRFAEILRSTIRESDLAGRMGGDEFIIYCKNINSEDIIAKKADYINTQILKSAKDFMGEDMTIPIGASVGCAFCPSEGRDFQTLFKKADKALYDVKQNGKHGYKVFVEAKKEDAGEDDKSLGLSAAMMLMGERNPARGAFLLTPDQFRPVYRFIIRVVSNYKKNVHLLLYTIKPEDENDADEAAEGFIEQVRPSLRESDVITRYSKNQILIAILNAQPQDVRVVTDRIDDRWHNYEKCDACSIECEIDHIPFS